MSLFYWLLLIAAISLTESIITSTGKRQQISNVPQNTTTHTNNENQEETSLQSPRVKRQTVETLKKFINITQAIPVKTVYIPVRMHQSKPTKTVRLHDVKRWLQSQFMAAHALFQVEQKGNWKIGRIATSG